MFSRTYSLRKSRKVLHWGYDWFKKKGHLLSAEKQNGLEHSLRQLEDALFSKDREKADRYAKHAEQLAHQHFKKSWWESGLEIFFAVLFALIVATLVRQMWFELYEIPTGSMRPNFREQDRLTVTKTAFGLNVPLVNTHFYFDPELVQRGKVAIFSAEGLPIDDTDTTYFGILPYKKRYIKRMIGKPGDSLYFYGGQIYGVDKDGQPIGELLNDPWMKKVEHIPFLKFEGEVSNANRNEFVFHHMNIPLGKIAVSRNGTIKGEVFDGESWIKENLSALKTDAQIHSYGDLHGIRNFAMARLLTKEELQKYGGTVNDLDDAVLYLQLKHDPNLTYPQPKLLQGQGYHSMQIPAFESIIPLQQEHVDALMDNLYTARFVVKNGKAGRYRYDHTSSGSAPFSGVPDGTYEFYAGKSEEVGFKGKTTLLDKNHPLYSKEPKQVQQLFNYGLDSMIYDPETFYKLIWPNRYAYFREGDLYIMGAPLLKKGDPLLAAFLTKEEEKAKKSTKDRPYMAFKDHGAPLKNGALDVEKIKTFGLKVPEKGYLVLGDNHAMSADSRVFGFVPEDNLEGAPSFIMWPPGERWGFPPQTSYPLWNLPRLIVWAIALTIFGIWYALHQRKMNTRLFPKD